MLGIVVVNWNDIERSVRCLRSVMATGRADLIPLLVDNSSAADPTQLLRQEMPEMNVLRLSRNRGYAGGVNAGVARVMELGADHILVLNNDTTLEVDALDWLLQSAADHPGAILGPKIVYSREQSRVWSAGGRLSQRWMKPEHVGQGEPSDWHQVDRKREWTTACAFLASADTFRRLGPLDEKYFLYLEDTDWCLRATRRGVETWFVSHAVVHHEVSVTVGTLPSAHTRYYAYRNYYRLVFRNSPVYRRPIFAADLMWTFVKIAGRWLLYPAYRRDRYYHARTAGLRDFVLGRWGEAPPSAVGPPGLGTHREPAVATGARR